MAELAPAWLLRLLRVPPPPRIPEGNARVFRAAIAYRNYRLFLWAVRQAGLVAGLFAGALFLAAVVQHINHPLSYVIGYVLEAFAVLGFLAQLPVGFLVARIDYAFCWYILSDRSLRLREGLVSIQEKTMTFANIQQVSIQQNPLQRVFGISDVKVETAGGGSGGKSSGKAGQGERMHEAYFRGMPHPEEIRDVILARVRMHRDSGLGEPQHVAALPSAASPAALDAAKELLTEMRALRQALPSRREQ
ncbi:PH domain-containing protein [Pyxidicoccus parkwayensis]|uniref:PH domain-containing protein n=1 Tax=Pyxidicoccus parkwayensis TaxID=2813578 RepID=A0ABX7NTG4_9BACT|nr:PH domain-containing protein [Pyxidicoccus parkwaysis]QSQ20686.1 PH domain-containing protein [Pyxidicoccus parkwaysis]